MRLNSTHSKPYTMLKCPFHNDHHASAAVYHHGRGGVPWFVCYACHVSMPLNEALRRLGEDELEYEAEEVFELDFSADDFRLYPPSNRALHYLEKRGVDINALPVYIGSTKRDNGVAFAFGFDGKYVGAQVRVFPERQQGDMRYFLEGSRLPFFGDYARFLREPDRKLLVVEKAFGALKVQQASDKFGLGFSVLCSAGSNVQKELFSYVTPETIFIMDDDNAGRKAAAYIKSRGYRVVLPYSPIDEWSLERITETLRRDI